MLRIVYIKYRARDTCVHATCVCDARVYVCVHVCMRCNINKV